MVNITEAYLEELRDTISRLQMKLDEYYKEIEKLKRLNNEYKFKIKTELEPRIESEKRSYDFSISSDTGEDACAAFEYYVKSLFNLIEDYPVYFEWDYKNGNRSEKVLYYLKRLLDE